MINLSMKNKDLILGKLAHDKNISSQISKNLIAYLEEFMQKGSRLALISPQRTVDGVVSFERSEWDTEHFGLGIGKSKFILFDRNINVESRRCLFQKAKSVAASQNLSVIFARIMLSDMPTIQSLELEGAILTDILLTFHIDLKRDVLPTRSSSVVEIVKADERDEQVLMEMASNIFKTDHFHIDYHLSTSKCNQLYAKWIQSCLKGLADTVLVAIKDGKSIGFITCKLGSIFNSYNYGIIDLVGVKKEYEGKGVGSMLITGALKWFSNQTESVYVGTQVTNIPAIRLYNKAGFRQILSEATLHLWIS